MGYMVTRPFSILLEELDCRQRVAVALENDGLEAPRQGGLNRLLQPRRDADEPRQDAQDTMQAARLRVIRLISGRDAAAGDEEAAHGGVETLMLALNATEDVETGRRPLELALQLGNRLFGARDRGPRLGDPPVQGHLAVGEGRQLPLQPLPLVMIDAVVLRQGGKPPDEVLLAALRLLHPQREPLLALLEALQPGLDLPDGALRP